MHKTLGGLETHLCDLHFPLPHPDGLLQVPVADLLPDVHHHLWSSELRQLLPELLVQSQGLGPVLGGGRDQLDCGLPWQFQPPRTYWSWQLPPPYFQCRSKNNVYIFKGVDEITRFWLFTDPDMFVQFRNTKCSLYSLSSSLPFFLLPFLLLLRNVLYFWLLRGFFFFFAKYT